MDDKENLRYDVKGHPIDLTEQDSKRTRIDNPKTPDRASTFHSGGGEPRDTIPRQELKSRRNFQQKPRATYKQDVGKQGGDNRQEPRHQPKEQEQQTGHDRRPSGYPPCKPCTKQRHTKNLFTCPKFPEYVPNGTDAKRLPKGVCPKCLAYHEDCDHRNF